MRAILVLDRSADHDVLAFASRARRRPEDDAFRRLLVERIFPDLCARRAASTSCATCIECTAAELPHQLLAAHQRARRYLVVAWHDVPRIVHDVLPTLYPDDRRRDAA